jgi:NADP-dependent aldehyde dehydrogenase
MAEQQGRTVQGINPRSGEKVGAPVPETTPAGLEAIAAAAAAAAPVFGGSSPQARIGLLNALA